MAKTSNNLVLIDGNAIIHRAYHSMPKSFTNKAGEPTNAIYGFALTLIRVIEDLNPNYMACSFDLAGPTFRHTAYKEYKATRIKADQELYDQIPRVKELVKTMGIPIFELQGFEADDVIGTIVSKIQGTRNNNQTNSNNQHPKNQNTQDQNLEPKTYNLTTYVVSGDKDIFQLVNGNVFIYDLKQGAGGARIINRQVIKNKYDLEPEDFIDFKALSGDLSDNIPGVPGIGEKTATLLLHNFGSLEKLYEAIEKFQDTRNLPAGRHGNNQTNHNNQISNNQTDPSVIPAEVFDSNQTMSDSRMAGIQSNELSGVSTQPGANWIVGQVRNDVIDSIKPRIAELLIKHKEQAFLSRELATIHKDVPIEFTLDSLRWREYDKVKLRQLFEELGFQSLLRRFGQSNPSQESTNPSSPLATSSKFAELDQLKTSEVKKKDIQLKLL